MNLSNEIKLIRCAAYSDAEDTTDTTGADVDVSGYEGVMFFAFVDKKTATTNKNVLKVEQKDADGNYTALTGASAEATNDDMVLWVDVFRPLQSQGKVLRAVIDTATATKTGDLYAVLYNGHIKPETLVNVADGGMNGALVISPVVVS